MEDKPKEKSTKHIHFDEKQVEGHEEGHIIKKANDKFKVI